MIHLRDFWGRHYLALEAGVVLCSVIALTAWMFLCNGTDQIEGFMKENRSNIYRTTATISGSLLGLSIAAISIAVSSTSSERLALLRGSKNYPTLWKTLFQAIQFLGGLTITALICLAWDRDEAPVPWLALPFAFFLGMTLVRVFRVIWILENVVGLISKPTRDAHDRS